MTTARADLRTDLANDRGKLSIGSRVQSFPHAFAFLFDVASSLLNLPVPFREHQGVDLGYSQTTHTLVPLK